MIRALVIGLMIPPVPAAAHEWYPTDCCHDDDCYELSDEDVVVLETGYYLVSSQELIGFNDRRVRRLPQGDDYYHRCSINGEQVDARTKCLILPVPMN